MKKITLPEFRKSLVLNDPPKQLTVHERALWFAGKGNWKTAHDTVQDLKDPFSARIHAFLHRQEGDISNAYYWYSKAGINMPDLSIEKEWEILFNSL